MGKIYNKTMDDVVQLSDDDTARRPAEKEFCLTAHVHFMATSMTEAMLKLARYFDQIASSDDREDTVQADKIFHAGTMTVGKASHLHLIESNPEVTH